MKKQNKKHQNARTIGEKRKTDVLWLVFFCVICKISNFNTWTAKHFSQASCTEFTLTRMICVKISRAWVWMVLYLNIFLIYRISANSFRGNYSFLKVGVRQSFKGGNYSREETINFLTFPYMRKLEYWSQVVC